jgi:hypothetical protein
MVSRTKIPTANRRKTKSVRFAPEHRLCEYQSGPKKLSLNMCDDLWYKPEEFQNFRTEARDSSLNAIRKGLSAYIKRTYGYTDKKTQDMYNMWARCSDTRRGLERFINEEYGRNRKFTQKKTVSAVLYAQERLWKDGERDYGRSSRVIRSLASAVSANAVAFAGMLGRADRAAVVSRRVVTVVQRVPSIRRTSTLGRTRAARPAAVIQAAKKQIAVHPEDDSSEHSDTIPVMGQSPEQKREKREKRDRRNLIKQANLGRREITFVPQR